jgi:type VI secretion system protein ImpG
MLTTEIHSIEKVFAASDAEPDVVQLEPYFSYDHASIQDERTRFWHARRVPSLNPDVPSTDMMLSFVDLNFNPDTLPVETVYARVNCTNRLLATTVPSNAVLQSDEKVPTESILCLYQPTDPIYPTSHGQSQWQLISHLSLSFLSLSSDGDSLTALKEILRLYSGSQLKQYEVEINSLLDMKTTHMVKRFGEDAWRGFTKGTGVELTIDEAESYGANSMFLFTAVLSQFFGLYARINSFTELSIKSNRREGVWKKWPAVAGTETFL